MWTAPVPISKSTFTVSSLPKTTFEVLSKNGCLHNTPSNCEPLNVLIILYSSIPAFFITWSTSSFAITNFSLFASTTAYINSLSTVIPMLPGNVHGVVVQITIDVSFVITPFPSTTGNFTNIDVALLSLYSISASANAVSHSVHQNTGFNPL